MAKQVNNDETDKIRSIILEHKIVSQYQPIVSVTKKKIIGLESLARGLDPVDNTLIAPLEIFDYAHRNSMILPLDRLCREKGIEGFLDMHIINTDLHLFINIDASLIDMVGGSNYLLRQVFKHNIPPENVVIEINESKVQNIEHLVRFVNNYRKSGFLIAIDDLGVGFSNFDRISLIKPDIIKIDRSLIKEIAISYYKQEIFKCIVTMANKIGAVVVAEGVETEEELNSALEYGAHLIQGYYFSRPQFLSTELLDTLNLKIADTAFNFKHYMNSKMKNERMYRRTIYRFLHNIIAELENNNPAEYDDLFIKYVNNYSDLQIECSYILDEQGIQVSNTLFSSDNRNHRQRLMFYPAVKGVDHSLKNYFYKLMNSREGKYLSNPYVSHATGNVCVTATKIFKHANHKNYILCVDFIHNI
jgi:EAL domain-containing protein (putative c-di-GMP-specific phosphodiesterase class I)